jgi:hypothetical protein
LPTDLACHGAAQNDTTYTWFLTPSEEVAYMATAQVTPLRQEAVSNAKCLEMIVSAVSKSQVMARRCFAASQTCCL